MLRFLAIVLVVAAFALFASLPLFATDSGSVTLAVGAPVTSGQDVPDFGGCDNGCRNRP